jgi:exopolysaccharide production protein ExoZ
VSWGSYVIYNLQVLRGVAAIGVVFYHTAYLLAGGYHTDFFGVSTFFVISGFIMCFISRADARDFLRNRMTRIVPMYWLCTAAYLLLTCKIPIEIISAPMPLNILRSALFLPSGDRPVLGVGWTLNFEMFFYVLFALSLMVSVRFAPLIVAAILLAIFALADRFPDVFLLQYYAQIYVRYFVVGIAAYYVYAYLPPFPRIVTACGGLAVIAFCYGSQFAEPLWANTFVNLLLYAMPGAIVICALLMEKAGVFTRSRVLLLLGDASYAIYLTHTILFKVLQSQARHGTLGRAQDSAAMMTIYVVAAIAIGVAVHLWIEKPVLRYIRRRFPNRSTEAASKGRSATDAVHA